RPIRSLIPARLDRLNWSPFRTRLVCGLGGAWILDGLQITVASSVSGELTKSSTLGMTSTEVGAQYSAINSAIDEVMPSKYRGRVDIWINGSYWAGAILGSFVSYIFLNHFAPNVGWRLAFLLGPVLAIFVIIVGRVLPESPRWLVT